MTYARYSEYGRFCRHNMANRMRKKIQHYKYIHNKLFFLFFCYETLEKKEDIQANCCWVLDMEVEFISTVFLLLSSVFHSRVLCYLLYGLFYAQCVGYIIILLPSILRTFDVSIYIRCELLVVI